jgi:hypothetical protein
MLNHSVTLLWSTRNGNRCVVRFCSEARRLVVDTEWTKVPDEHDLRNQQDLIRRLVLTPDSLDYRALSAVSGSAEEQERAYKHFLETGKTE